MFLLATSDARPEEVDVTALWEVFPSFDVASTLQTCKMRCRLTRGSQPPMERHFRIICLCCSFLLVSYNKWPLLVPLEVHFDDGCNISYLFSTFWLSSEKWYFMGPWGIISTRLWWICFHSSLCRLTLWIPWSFHGPTRWTRWLQISVDVGPTAHWMNDTNGSSAQVIFQSTAKLPQEVPGWSGMLMKLHTSPKAARNFTRHFLGGRKLLKMQALRLRRREWDANPRWSTIVPVHLMGFMRALFIPWFQGEDGWTKSVSSRVRGKRRGTGRQKGWRDS